MRICVLGEFSWYKLLYLFIIIIIIYRATHVMHSAAIAIATWLDGWIFWMDVLHTPVLCLNG